MRIDILKQPLMVTLLLFAALAVLFCLRFVSFPYPGELAASHAPVALLLQGAAARVPSLSMIISLLLVFSNGLAISRILSSHMVLSSRTYLPMIIYLITGCGVWYAGADPASLLGAFLLIRASECFIASFVRTSTFDITFRGAFLVGIIPILYPPAAIYLIMIPIAMVIFKRRGREAVVSLIGGVLPMLTYAYIMWILDFGFIATFTSFWAQLTTDYAFEAPFESIPEIMQAVSMGLIAAMTAAGLVSFAIFSGKMRTRARAIFMYAIALLVVGCASLFIPAAGPLGMLFIALPVSLIMPAFFSNLPGVISGAAYLALLLCVTLLNLYPFFFS